MTVHGYHVARRDANEKEMVEAWHACGALWFPQPETSGFDGILLCKDGSVHFVEVKDLRAQHNRFYLTENERKMRQEIEARGQKYELVTNMAQALALVGAA